MNAQTFHVVACVLLAVSLIATFLINAFLAWSVRDILHEIVAVKCVLLRSRSNKDKSLVRNTSK